MKGKRDDMQTENDGNGEGRLWRNIGQVILLAAILVAAWFVLDALIGK